MSYQDMRANKVFPYVLNAKKGIARGFVSLQVGLTHECLNRCIMCQHWARPNAGSRSHVNTTDLIRNVIMPFINMGGETICFSGGEPFNHPDIYDILNVCISNGLGIGFITSGAGTAVNPPSPKLLRLLASCAWVRISLDAIDPEVYKASRGPGYESVMANLNEYIHAGVKLGFGITLHKRNHLSLNNTLEWILKTVPKHQIESIRCWFVRGEPQLELTTQEMIDAHVNAYAKLLGTGLSGLSNLDALERQAAGKPELPDDAPALRCVVPLVHCYIDASLRAYACCIHAGDAELKPAGPQIADMNVYTLKDLWDSVEHNEHHKRKNYGGHPSCAGCTLRLYTINKTFKDIEDGMLYRGNFL